MSHHIFNFGKFKNEHIFWLLLKCDWNMTEYQCCISVLFLCDSNAVNSHLAVTLRKMHRSHQLYFWETDHINFTFTHCTKDWVIVFLVLGICVQAKEELFLNKVKRVLQLFRVLHIQGINEPKQLAHSIWKIFQVLHYQCSLQNEGSTWNL